MAKIPNLPAQTGLFARMGMSAKRWMSSFSAPAQQIKEGDQLVIGAGSTTVASLLTSGKKGARTRQAIYDTWAEMESDSIISTALKLAVTSALGGHETSGNLVFIEKNPAIANDKSLNGVVDEIRDSLTPIFNRIAYQMCYTGAAFGDSYARVYANRTGVVDLYTDEMVRPQLIIPFEKGSRTVGFALFLGQRNFERLDASQLVRMRMPRQQWVPQYGVIEKNMRMALTEDNIDALPILPGMVGGSFLYNAEDPYDKLTSSLLGLVGQRWLDSIDEQMVGVNLESMTVDQQKRFLDSVVSMLTASKDRAEAAIKNGRPVLERIRHILPVFNDKQLTTISPTNGGAPGRASTITIDDVMMHARMLAGALGYDLSMLGFADQLSGGLGDGGFFRVSAQAAENSRVIRVAFSEMCNAVADLHTMRRYGMVYHPNKRPWHINFYGSISALDAEKQRTRADSMAAGMTLAQSMQMLKDMGATTEIAEEFLTKTMALDEAQAKVYAKLMETKKPDAGGFGDMP